MTKPIIIAAAPTSVRDAIADALQHAIQGDDLGSGVRDAVAAARTALPTAFSLAGAVPGESISIFCFAFDKAGVVPVSPLTADPADAAGGNKLLHVTLTEGIDSFLAYLEGRLRKAGIADFLADAFEVLMKELTDRLTDELSLRLVELKVRIPVLSELQKTSGYERNAFLMLFDVTVRNASAPSGAPHAAVEDSCRVPVWLPPLGESAYLKTAYPRVDVTLKPNLLKGGPPSSESWDPIPPGWEVRWYGWQMLAELEELRSFDVRALAALSEWNPIEKSALVLPQALKQLFGSLRRRGQLIEDLHARHEHLGFHVPSGAGLAVMWRDDIPSLPLDFLEYLDQRDAAHFAPRLWGWTGFEGIDISVPYPLELKEPIRLQVTQLTEAADNLLARLLGKSGFEVRFAWALDGDEATLTDERKNELDYVGRIDVEQLPPELKVDPKSGVIVLPPEDRVQGVDAHLPRVLPDFTSANGLTRGNQPAELFYHPHVVAPGHEWDGETSFTLQLIAQFKLPHVEERFIVWLEPKISFTPKELPIPTLTVCFQHSQFEGAPLFLLPRGKLPRDAVGNDDFWDHTREGELGTMIPNALEELSFFTKCADIISWLFGGPKLRMIARAIDELNGILHPVLDQTGYISDLHDRWSDDDLNYDDIMSSIILIGAPHSLTSYSVKCYRDTERGGDWVQFSIPDGQFVAAVHSFCNLGDQWEGGELAVPLPRIVTSDPELTDFNDEPSSIEYGEL